MKGTRLQHLHGNEELDPDVDMNHWGGMERGWGVRGPAGVGRGGGTTSPGVGNGRLLGGVGNSGGKRQVVEGETLPLKKVSRLQMGSYLCIASNGIPPSVSKRAHLKVQCMCLYQFFHSRAPPLSLSPPARTLIFVFLTFLSSSHSPCHKFVGFPSLHSIHRYLFPNH